MVITDKKVIGIFVAIIIVIIFLFTLFSWAKPMTLNDKDDVEAISSLLAEDNAKFKILSIGDLSSYGDKYYQFVECAVVKDSVRIEKSIMIEVEKKFLNYQCKGILKP